VSDAPAIRASDAEREHTVALLREHTIEGRLTLEELAERAEGAYTATTRDELEALTRDLPVASEPSGRRPTRFVVSLFRPTVRDGRLRLAGRVTSASVFGPVDLDLRNATIEGDEVSIVAVGVCGPINVLVPEGIDVDLRGLTLFGPKGVAGPDSARPGMPIVRVHAVGLFSPIRVWHVPLGWMGRSPEDVVKGLEVREPRELRA
jgi:hypothetical protein